MSLFVPAVIINPILGSDSQGYDSYCAQNHPVVYGLLASPFRSKAVDIRSLIKLELESFLHLGLSPCPFVHVACQISADPQKIHEEL